MDNQTDIISLVSKFVDGCRKASGGCSQMLMHHQKIEYAPIRSLLERVMGKALSIAQKESGIVVRKVTPGQNKGIVV